MIDGCTQATITGVSFVHLKSIQALGMWKCSDVQVATVRSLGLPVNTRECISFGALHNTFDERAEDEGAI